MFTKNDGEEHNFWISYTDLVLGFMIVFIVIALILFNQIPTQEKRDIETEIKVLQKQIDSLNQRPNLNALVDAKYLELVDIFKSKFGDINEIEVTDEAIRFLLDETAGKPLFIFREHHPTDYFKNLLNQFIPVFFDEVYQIYAHASDTFTIKELRIEGHTDSRGDYLLNLSLSSARAVRVQSHILRSKHFEQYPEQFQEFVKKNSIACGYSFTRLLDEHGELIETPGQKEDPDKSRRVEFRILLEQKNSQL